MKNPINILFYICLLLNFSEAFRPLGVLLGIKSSSTTSTLSLIVNFTYLFVNFRNLKLLLKSPVFRNWAILLAVAPTILMLISVAIGFLSPSEYLYWTSFNLLYASFFIAASVYALQNGAEKAQTLVYISILTTVIGFVINYTNYSFTQRILEFSGSMFAKQQSLFRALSFFQHSNVAAFSIIAYFVILFQTKKSEPKSTWFYILSGLALFAGIFITGSRTSLILAAVMCIFLYAPFKRSISRSQKIDYRYAGILVSVWIIFILFAFAALLPLLEPVIEKYMSEETLLRMNIFNALMDGSYGDLEDASLSARITILSKYWKYIESNPIFGYGPQFVRNKLESGEFTNVSQNSFIEYSIYMGIPYGIYFLYNLYKTYKHANRDASSSIYSFNALKVFVVFLFLLSFSVNNIFWYRSIVITLGLLLGANIRLNLIQKIEHQKKSRLREKAFLYNRHI